MVQTDDPQAPQGDGVLGTGTHIDGYELQWRIGEGGGAVVYRCLGPDGNPAAIKLRKREADAGRLDREADTLESLAHPAFPHFLGRVPGGFVMELVEGSHLGGARLPAPHAAGVVARVADALAYLHSQGIAHRDVKPENVLVDRMGNVRLIDLGGVADLSASGASLHTPGYRPPEADPSGATMDAYALGVLLDRLTVGDRPAELSLLIGELTSADPSLRPPPSVVSQRLAPFATDPGPFLSSTRADDVEPRVDPARPFGRYSLRKVLGRGGMGTVWEAYDTEADRVVALKIAHGHRSRLAREAKAIANLEHPNVVSLLDFGEHEGSLFLAMELVRGTHLGSRLDQGALPGMEAVGIAIDVARGLGAAHEQGLVHRDVKPANILLDEGRARLADFGLVQLDDASVELTHVGARLGTPAYMAPEQARGEQTTAATDVFGLGAVLFHMLEGRPPFQAVNVASMMSVVGRGGAPELSSKNPSLRRVVARAMADHPADRYLDGAAFAADLARIQAGQRIAGPARVRPWLRQQRIPLLVASAMTGVALAIFGGQFVAAQNAESSFAEQAQLRVHALEARATQLRTTDAKRADAMLDEGLLAPEVRGSVAASEAWLRIADRRTGDERLSALARSYLDAPDRERVLVALGNAFHEQGDPESARRAGWLLAGIGASGPALALVAEAQVAARQVGAEEGELAAPLARLAHTMPVDGIPARYAGGGGRVLVDGAVHKLVESDGRLGLGPVVLRTDRPVAFTKGAYQVQGEQRGELFDDAGSLGTLNSGGLLNSTLADIDHDGDDDLVLSAMGKAVVVDLEARTTRHLLTPPEGARGGMVLAQLDGEGPWEFVAPTGPWTFFDLRVYRLDGSESPPLIARESTGSVAGIGRLSDPAGDRVLLAQDSVYGSKTSFPAGNPHGLSNGMHVFALVDGLLVQEATLTFGPCSGVLTTDLDGDGTTEVLANCDGGLAVVTRSDGALHTTMLDEIVVRDVFDLDGDGDDEVLALVSGEWRLLGAGSEPLAELAAPVSLDVHDPIVKRALELHELGLSKEALLRLELLETMDPERAALAAFHRGRALADLSRFEEAEAALVTASHDPSLTERALEIAADAAFEDGRAADAVALAQRLLAAAPELTDSWAERLALWSSAEQGVLDYSLIGELPAGVRPFGGTLTVSDGGLRTSSTLNNVLLEVPVQRTGGPLRIELDMTLERAEWGGGINISYLPVEGPVLLSTGLMPVGGAGVVNSEIKCHGGGHIGGVRKAQPSPELHMPGRYTLRVHPDRSTTCAHDVVGIAESVGPIQVASEGWVVISGQGAGPGMLTEATLRRLRIHGATLREPGPDETREETVAQRIATLERDGDSAAADRLLLEEVGRTEVLAQLARPAPSRWLPMLRQELSPQEYFQAWASVYYGAAIQHQADPRMDNRLITDLPGLERVEFDDPRGVVALLCLRAAALRRAGQIGAARAHINRGWELAERGVFVGLARESALLELADRDKDAAMLAIVDALQRSSIPELLGDHLSRHPGLEPLHGHRDWGLVAEARLLRGE